MSQAAAQVVLADREGEADATAVSSAELARSNEWCAAVVKSRARNFYHGLRLTPEPRRSAIYAVYAWMRRADDAVDAPGTAEEKKARLDHLRAATEAMLAGKPLPASEANAPVWPAFTHAVRTYGVSSHEVQAMLGGLESDTVADTHDDVVLMHDTREELEQYCYGVASVVGRVCVKIWGLRAEEDLDRALELAETRGLAFQLTNILRDLRQDYEEGRVYLAREDLAAFEVSADDLLGWSEPDRCEQLVRSVAQWARESYESSAALESMIDPACAPAMWAMTRIYRGLLDRIEAEPDSVVGSKRIRLASWRKLAIGCGAVVRTKLATRA